jgi:hypothetical protein
VVGAAVIPAPCPRRTYDPVSGKTNGNGDDYYVFGLSGKAGLCGADILGSTETNQRHVFRLIQKALQEEFGRKMPYSEIRRVLSEART